MNILLTHPHCWPYVRRGTERNIDNVSRSLAMRGHAVTLLSTWPVGVNAERGDASAQENAVVVRRLLNKPFWTPALGFLRLQPEHMFGISSFMGMQNLTAEVVHSFFYSDSLAASSARKKKRWRTVLQLNGIAVPGVSCHRLFPPEGWMIRRAIHEADEFVVCSSFIGDVAEQYYGRRAKVVVPPIEIADWPFCAEMPEGPPVMLAVGDFNVRRKGIRALLKAFEIFRQMEPEAILRVSGRPVDASVRMLLDALPEATRRSVEFMGLGQPGDLPRLYRQASMLVLPAMWEPSGTVMFEAMACGTPVVATRHGGLPEFLNEECSVLFEPKSEGEETQNAEGLADAMAAGLRLSRLQGTRQNCRRQAERYSSEIIVPKLEELYARA